MAGLVVGKPKGDDAFSVVSLQKGAFDKKDPFTSWYVSHDVGISDVEPSGPNDAGFVLESKGKWWHAGYHLTTSIAGPALLSLPYALSNLGWSGGLCALTVAAIVSSYSYCLLSQVLERTASLGHRFYRFRDLSHHVIGPRWTNAFVAPVQFGVCFVTVVASVLTGGYGSRLIYLALVPHGSIQLYEFVIFYGFVTNILAQLPSFHSLRYISLASIILCLVYSVCALVGCILAGHNKRNVPKDYTVVGSSSEKLFGVFTALSVITGGYGVAIIPEIQATLAPPVTGKMFKGIALCYTVVICTFFSVAIAGYWAFGNTAQANIITNLSPTTGLLIPEWLIAVASVAAVIQLLAIGLVYLQPTFDAFEGITADVAKGRFSLRNFLPRLVLRTVYVAFATLIAAMFPFFADILSFIGAFGYTPLDFVLPMLFYQRVFKPSRRTSIFWVNWVIMVTFTFVGVLGCISSIRRIVIDAKTFKLFSNV